MRNAELISVLNQYKMSHQAIYWIKRLGLFGSNARCATTDQSVIDIVVELKNGPVFGINYRELSIQLGPTPFRHFAPFRSTISLCRPGLRCGYATIENCI